MHICSALAAEGTGFAPCSTFFRDLYSRPTVLRRGRDIQAASLPGQPRRLSRQPAPSIRMTEA